MLPRGSRTVIPEPLPRGQPDVQHVDPAERAGDTCQRAKARAIPAMAAARRTSLRRLRLTYRAQVMIMLAPFLLGMVIWEYLPAIGGLGLALFTFNGIEPPTFRGLGNLREMANDRIFRIALINSLIFIGIAVPLRLVGALMLALLLARRARGVGIHRAAVYLPTVVPDVAWAVAWLWVLNPLYGPLNQALGLVGITGPAWTVEEWPARLGIILMISWQLGEGFVVCLAALSDVPQALRDQAAVDGGTAWQTFWHVVLPLIAPVLLILLFRDTIFSLQANFVPALIVGRGGGPNYATTFLPLHIYREAFDYMRFGYAAALTWAMLALTGVMLALQYWVANRWKLGFRHAQ